ncbi:MAG: hypothetical protein ACTSRS_02760 [Candidatus Helarchaeota archaeon]
MSKQLIDFANKKGDYYCELAEEHLRSREPKKAKSLLLSAVEWYKKAGNEEKAKIAKEKADKIQEKQ